MLKVKKNENKKTSPAKADKANAGKAKKAAKKPPPAKQIKEQKDSKVKKVVKGGLVKAPPAGSPKVGSPQVKKVLDAEKLAAIRERRKQKKLEKKLKKAAEKKKTTVENGKKLNDSDAEAETSKPVKSAKAKPAKKVAVKPTKNGETEEEGETGKEISHTIVKPKQTVFVGNLPSNTKRVQLLKLFKQFGTILTVRFRTASGRIIFKHKARKESNSLNAYILFDSEESAAKALELNNFEFKGHHIRVTPTGAEDQQRDPKRTVVVGNLKYAATDEQLHQIFSSCGEIEYVRTIQNGDKGCNGVGFVCFKNPDAVGLALELKGTVLDERPINVERYKTTKSGGKVKTEKDGNPNKGPKVQGGLNKAKQGAKGQANGKKAPGSPKKPQGPGKNKGGKGAVGAKAKSNGAAAAKKQTGKGPKKAAGSPQKAAEPTEGADSKKSKPEFRGVKSTIVKKKQKKVPSAMKKLAMKIAPKSDD